ncbi:MAG: DUF6178 family protein [bacterium]
MSSRPRSKDGLALMVTRTVREALSLAERDPGKLLEIFPQLPLLEQRDVVMFTGGPLRQELIASTSHAGRLVAMLPEEELYLTLREVGLANATVLLSFMTPEQDRYLADIDLWQKEEFEPSRFLKLVEVLLECGEDRLHRWLAALDPELLVLLLRRHGRVSSFDTFQEPMESSDEVPSISYQGVYRYHPGRQELRPIMDSILRILHATDPERYEIVMESAHRDQVSEVREEALRWRETRLSEKGLPSFEEACQIYRPLAREELERLAHEVPAEGRKPEAKPAVLYPVLWLPGESFFRKVLRKAARGPQGERIRTELAALGNKVVVADGLDPGDPSSLRYCLEKAAGFITIALELLTGGGIEAAASWVSRSWLHFLFRLGYGQVLELVRRAREDLPATRFRWIDRYRYLPDSPLEETLRGLLLARPLMAVEPTAENYLGFREFASLRDIRIADRRLRTLEALADLFVRKAGLPPEQIKGVCLQAGMGDRLETVKWSHVLNTMWANRMLADLWEFRPLVPGQVRRLLRIAFETGKEGAPGRIKPRAARALTRWANERAGTTDQAMRKSLNEAVQRGLEQMEQELGSLAEDAPIDWRFIESLCITP